MLSGERPPGLSAACEMSVLCTAPECVYYVWVYAWRDGPGDVTGATGSLVEGELMSEEGFQSGFASCNTQGQGDGDSCVALRVVRARRGTIPGRELGASVRTICGGLVGTETPEGRETRARIECFYDEHVQ